MEKNITTDKPVSSINIKTVNPPVLYVGTPVALITTQNEDGTANISPMSSVWALYDRLVCGMSSSSQCHENILREMECVINYPSAAQWTLVEKMARATGKEQVPASKAEIGYEYVKDKFSLSGFTSLSSETVKPPRITECPIQIEGKVVSSHSPEEWPLDRASAFSIVEILVTKVHAHEDIVIPETDYIDTNQWHPLFYVFRHYFGTGKELGKTFKA